MKRFYKLVSTKKTDEGYSVQLDGKSVKTPAGQSLLCPSRPLADAIAAEWQAQADDIVPDSMPLTQILTTAIERQRDRVSLTRELMKYLDTDLVCYYVREPEALAARQKEIWTPHLAWFDEHFEVPLDCTADLAALRQDEEARSRVWNYIEGLDEYYFAALHIVTAATGSIVLGMAFIEGAADPDRVYEAAWLEEIYHADLANEAEYGADPITAKKQAAMRIELEATRRFLDLLDSE